jgi:hypothetical protein
MLGDGICDWEAISLSEPFTPFTALNSKGNPAFGPFTRVKGCDPEIVSDFSEVNRVKGYRRIREDAGVQKLPPAMEDGPVG